ncbi:cysteine--tRNA ligase [Candidatus Pacearchaeota archaeon]|nr:cysteine--tRNA ligase [Candidatus Pacearchaeota archaeon]
MTLKLHNTLTRKKETFKPLRPGQVGLYTCGPTVYWFQHIGNLRAYIFADTLRRTLDYNGLKVNHIINVTDVGHLTSDADHGEDKVEAAAKKEGKTAAEITKFYYDQFIIDLKKLNILPPKKWTWATKYIKEQIELVKTLEKKGYTYQTSDGIYYDTDKKKDYGAIALLKKEGLQAGKRIDMGEKKNKTDFALWKFSNPDEQRQQEWPSPWGVGFPGWHIECSAMSMKELGETFDIHTGGEDHIHVHHPNEIAQAEAATGKKFVNYWLHNSFLTNQQGEKVSKSKGGLYTLSELEDQGYAPEDYRYFNLLTNYRKPLQFSLENLDAAQTALNKLKRKITNLRQEDFPGKAEAKSYETKFLKAVNDDLNTPLAIEVLNSLVEDQSLSSATRIKTAEQFDEALGLGIADWKPTKTEIPPEVQDLIDQRELARKSKDFAQADILRCLIKERGFVVEDSEQGPKVEKA